jgi:hypothetical protein
MATVYDRAKSAGDPDGPGGGDQIVKGVSRHFSYANVMSTLAVFMGIAGGSVAVAAIPDDNSVDSAKVINESLKSEDLMNDAAVKSVDVIDEEIRSVDIAPDTVAGVDIAPEAVKSSDIDDEGILSGDIAPDAVTGSEIATDAVAALDIASNAVGSGEIATSAVGSSEIALNGVGTGEIALNAVGNGDIATNGVGSSEVATSSIHGEEIAPSSVGSSEIIDGSITGSDVGEVIDASEIGDDPIYRVESSGTTFEDVDSARNGDYGIGSDSVSCNENRGTTGELISGGANWVNTSAEGDEQFISEVRYNMDTETVTVVGGLDNGSQGGESFRTLRAIAVCLSY